jgi:hypothetical protein
MIPLLLPLQLPPADPRKHNATRHKFSPDEDHHLRSLVQQLGAKSWEAIAAFMPDRTARQCRDRYKNYLLSSLVSDAWTPEEDQLILEKFREIGPKWVEISKLLTGRSGNHVKNRWHKHLSRPPPDPDPVAFPSVQPAETENRKMFALISPQLPRPGIAESDPAFPPRDPAVSIDQNTFRPPGFGGSVFCATE